MGLDSFNNDLLTAFYGPGTLLNSEGRLGSKTDLVVARGT